MLTSLQSGFFLSISHLLHDDTSNFLLNFYIHLDVWQASQASHIWKKNYWFLLILSSSLIISCPNIPHSSWTTSLFSLCSQTTSWFSSPSRYTLNLTWVAYLYIWYLSTGLQYWPSLSFFLIFCLFQTSIHKERKRNVLEHRSANLTAWLKSVKASIEIRTKCDIFCGSSNNT